MRKLSYFSALLVLVVLITASLGDAQCAYAGVVSRKTVVKTAAYRKPSTPVQASRYYGKVVRSLLAAGGLKSVTNQKKVLATVYTATRTKHSKKVSISFVKRYDAQKRIKRKATITASVRKGKLYLKAVVKTDARYLSGGAGTRKKPFIIKTGKEWNYVAGHIYFANKHLRLGADITAQKLKAWNWGKTPFSGSLDGRDKIIARSTFVENTCVLKKGKTTTKYYSGATAITSLKGALVKNLTFKDCRFIVKAKAASSKAAASSFFIIADSTLQKVTIANSKFASSHSTRSAGVAGFAESIKRSTLTDCTVRNSAISSGAGSAAGIAINVTNSQFVRVASVSNRIRAKSPSAISGAAGLAYLVVGGSNLTLCRAAHNTVTASVQASGFVGKLSGSSIGESYVRAGQVIVAGKNAQKAAGLYLNGAAAQVSNSYVAGTVVNAGNAQAFGFGEDFGLASDSSVKNCYSDAILSGAVDQCYPFMSNQRTSSTLLGISNCFGAWREGYNSITGGAHIVTPWQITTDAGNILALADDAGTGTWTFSAGNYPLLVNNP